MKSMPYLLKQKLRQYDKANRRASQIHDEIIMELEKFGVPYGNLAATADYYGSEPITEGLAFINNCEGNIEDNIADIEEVFLHFVNKK